MEAYGDAFLASLFVTDPGGSPATGERRVVEVEAPDERAASVPGDESLARWLPVWFPACFNYAVHFP